MARLMEHPAPIATLLGGAAVLAMAGSANASAVLSNLSAFTGSEPLSFYSVSAQGATQFTTGGGSWTLTSISMRGFASIPGTMEIWTDAAPGSGSLASVPGTRVATSATAVAGASQAIDFDFTSGGTVTLAGGTTYWMVFNGPSSSMGFRQSTTAATAQGGSGWSGVTNSLFRSVSTQPTWADATLNNYSLFYSINATASAVPGGSGVAWMASFAAGAIARRRRR